MNRQQLVDSLRPLARYSDWIILLSVGALAVGVALWVAGSARAVRAAARAEIMKAERAAAMAGDVRARFVPAGNDEIAEWNRTRAEVADFGVPSQMRVALVQIVTRAAEDAGFSRVRARFAPADSVVSPPPRVVAGQEFIGAGYGIMLQGEGDAGAAARLLAALPAAVDVQQLTVENEAMTIILAVYRPGQALP